MGIPLPDNQPAECRPTHQRCLRATLCSKGLHLEASRLSPYQELAKASNGLCLDNESAEVSELSIICRPVLCSRGCANTVCSKAEAKAVRGFTPESRSLPIREAL